MDEQRIKMWFMTNAEGAVVLHVEGPHQETGVWYQVEISATMIPDDEST